MAFDFKKEYKELYMPKNKPEIVHVPKANDIAVRGRSDPNEETSHSSSNPKRGIKGMANPFAGSCLPKRKKVQNGRLPFGCGDQ